MNDVPDNVIVQNENNTTANQGENGMSKIYHIDECSGHEIPKSVEVLKSSLIDPTDLDLTVVVLYALIAETGFNPMDVTLASHSDRLLNIERPNRLIEMPHSWKDPELTYKMSFYIPSVPYFKCELVCSKTLDFLSVVMFCCETADIIESYSMLINPSEYVKCGVFSNLKRLSMNFKNNICLPVRCQLLNAVGLNDGLLAVPVDVLYKIFDYLNANTFIKLISTCKSLYENFSNDSIVWQKLCKREFPEFCEYGESDDVWKNTYKMLKYKVRQRTKFVYYVPEVSTSFNIL